MAITLEQILTKVGAYVDQDTTLPSGTDLTVRVNLVNRALNEWSDTYEWRSLRKTFQPTVLYSMTSLGLPSNFKRLMSAPYDMSLVDTKYEEINPSDRFSKNAEDKYCYILGDNSSGNYVVFNPPLASGASIVVDYQCYPSSLATYNDVSQVPHPEYLAQRTIAYVLESRSDGRYPSVKSDADRMLQSMIEWEVSKSGGQNNRVSDWMRSSGFKPGY